MRAAPFVLAVLGLAACGSSPRAATAPRAATSPVAATTTARETCSTRSEATFPGAFTDHRNFVLGPLALIGGAYTDAETVREFGGQKFPLLVKAGHTVTVALAPDARAIAGLAYGPLPEGETRLRDTHRAVTFVACRGRTTFWSGAVLTRMPVCLPLDIAVDGGRPRRVAIPLGARC